jgi:hypothetical protein
VSNSEAARLAATIRAGVKRQGLTGVELAKRVEQLTGEPYPAVYVSRRLNNTRPLIAIADDLYPLCEALGIDPAQAVADAINGHHEPDTDGEDAQ